MQLEIITIIIKAHLTKQCHFAN